MSRLVVAADALEFLTAPPTVGNMGAIVTSLPDAEEIDMSIPDWMDWFYKASILCMQSTDPDCPTIFYQTDRKHDGRWLSKAMLIYEAALALSYHVLWHKIVLRRDPGKVDLHRPGYSHMIAVSRRGRPGKAMPDVLAPSPSVYPNGMPIRAAFMAVGYARQYSPLILDPFCGRGTVLAMAERFGFEHIIGVDIDPDQCLHARLLEISEQRLRELSDLPGVLPSIDLATGFPRDPGVSRDPGPSSEPELDLSGLPL